MKNQRRPVIKVTDLVKIYDSRRVLDGVSIEVHPGQTAVIMGGSGCGKSTLLRSMIGSVIPDEGSIELFGQNIETIPACEFDDIRKRFGILFQSGALFNSLTVGENVSLPMREHTDLDDKTIDIMVTMKLELVGLR
ncbi:MAG TPA: ATP-binding cassette domain-containing protein, partial [Phycisphaerae bacterium]|nr:ATP-binding cassette domain-containing protein [Phycisphaerae bacterium]